MHTYVEVAAREIKTVARRVHKTAFIIHFQFPASSNPFASPRAPFSRPEPILPTTFPTGLPKLPVAPVMVLSTPRPAAPVTPPTVRVTPPTVFPSVDVTNLAAPVTPVFWLEELGMVDSMYLGDD